MHLNILSKPEVTAAVRCTKPAEISINSSCIMWVLNSAHCDHVELRREVGFVRKVASHMVMTNTHRAISRKSF